MMQLTRREQTRQLQRRGAAAHVAMLFTTTLDTWRQVAFHLGSLKAIERAATNTISIIRTGSAFAQWALLDATIRWVSHCESNVVAVRGRRRQNEALVKLRKLSYYAAMMSNARLLNEAQRLTRGVRRLSFSSYRAAKLDHAVTRYWKRSPSARALRKSVMLAFRVFLRSCKHAANKLDQIAIAHEYRRLSRRALACWIVPARLHQRKVYRGRELMRTAGMKRCKAAFIGWNGVSTILSHVHSMRRKRRLECTSAHLSALRELMGWLRCAKELRLRSDRAHERRHLHALASYCAHRRAVREAGESLMVRQGLGIKAGAFQSWRRQKAAACAARAFDLCWFEGFSLLCWGAWKGYAVNQRREKAQAVKMQARMEARLHAKPSAYGAGAYRCLARWRLLLISRVLNSWVTHTKGRIIRRYAFNELHELWRSNLMRRCVMGWREVMWHDQLIRKVRQVQAEEAMDRAEEARESARKAARRESGVDDVLPSPWFASSSPSVPWSAAPPPRTPAEAVSALGFGDIYVGILEPPTLTRSEAQDDEDGEEEEEEELVEADEEEEEEEEEADARKSAEERAEELQSLEARIAALKARVRTPGQHYGAMLGGGGSPPPNQDPAAEELV